ncbi:MAG: peptidoglycan DD-metalloendopeptidase family protein [Leptolyngbyaceae cyanobacterium CSU_1_3]|nr:peptidoglycan DD-metalloendopeptidase family protein [Leptolyngbyaceae cyanobacterium CSU_1_3]
MKRAFPQEINPVPFSAISNDAVIEQPKQALPESNRCVRTSAAMIGLAISMGAYSLLAPQGGDAAVAAEPVPAEPMTASAATPPDVAVLPPVSEPASATQPDRFEHTVQEGQTLWKIAQLYKIGVSRLAATNNLRPDNVLYVGQRLQVPAEGVNAPSPAIVESAPKRAEVASSDLQAESAALAPSVPVSQPGVPTPAEAQQLLKNKQDVAVQSLKQQRDRLKQSLAELKSEESDRTLQDSTAQVSTQAEEPPLVGYQVNSGETLSSIAQAHGVSPSELVRINQLANPNLLRTDQFIKIPQTKLASQQPVVLASPSASVSVDRAAAVTVPVVPSLSAATRNSAPNLDLTAAPQPVPSATGVGGDSEQFAMTNSAPITSGGQFNATQTPRSIGVEKQPEYVNSLVSEIVKLRENHSYRRAVIRQSQPLFSGRAQAPSKLTEVPQRVNPEFRPNRNLETLQAELRSLQQRKPQDSKPKVVAAAPSGSESYAPLVRSSVGKMVSPTLPPLGKPDSYLPGSGKLTGYVWPAKGMLTSPYGWRWGRMHRGIDIAAPIGTPVVAAAPGKVITSGWNDGGYGNLVEVKHSDGSVTLYAHNNRLLVKVGQQVAQGQQIAEMGSTGFSTGPHTHFEVHLPGQGAVNPVALLPQGRG